MTAEQPQRPIDLLTPAGRQAVLDQIEADHQTVLAFHQQLEALAERFEANVHEVDWSRDVAPVSTAALDHILTAIDYANTVQRRLLDLDLDLEGAGGIGDELDAEFTRIHTARRSVERDEMQLSTLTSRLGERYRAALTDQFFT
ncbi:hypothetical protein [Glycomyces sp. MUSA5-2]|uniref:hypothetical protein n=1 Tax=Glycomyces sp. MUSA5-2 TaxID=2053002 RepID=UPI003009EDAC